MLENMERIKEEVKKRLRSMGKHGDFEIEEVRESFFYPLLNSLKVKDNANGKLVYHMERAGKWEKTAQKTHIFA